MINLHFCIKIFVSCVCLIIASVVRAQRNEIVNDRIQSLQVVANGDWLSLPVMELGNGYVDIDFDDMSHEYRRYVYKLEHCEADWTVSEDIFESDYCEGFADGNTIDDVEKSLMTNTLYTQQSAALAKTSSASPATQRLPAWTLLTTLFMRWLRTRLAIAQASSDCTSVILNNPNDAVKVFAKMDIARCFTVRG